MPKKSSTLRKVAVFDIDGTIFRSSLVIELTEEFIKQGIFPKRAYDIFKEEHNFWLERKGTYDDYIAKVVKASDRYIKGVRVEDAMKVAEQVMVFHKNRVYRHTRALVEKYRDTHFLLAISHSPYHVVEPFCREWGFHKVYARIFVVDKKGRFTGEVQNTDFINDKDTVLKYAIEKEHLTLKGSLGVGDSAPDARMLSLVENPIAFNPDAALYKIAKRKKWSIVVERKNMIYHI